MPGALLQVFFIPENRKAVLLDPDHLDALLKRDRSAEKRARAEQVTAEAAAFEARRQRALRGEDPDPK